MDTNQAKCNQPDCMDPAGIKGMCRRHYKAAWYLANRDHRLAQQAEYAEANRETKRAYDRVRYPEIKEKHKAIARAWYYAHQEQQKAKSRAAYQAQKYERAAKEREKKFGLTQEGFDALLAVQNGRCAICRSETPGGRGGFAVDHCHEIGHVRGLLCTNCNNGLGRFKDNPDHLIAAADYLRRMAVPS